MSDRSRLDPEMVAFMADAATEGAKHPPIKMELPYEPSRRIIESLV